MEGNAFDRIVALLHEAALDDARWPAASGLIDEACRAKGNSLILGDGVHTRSSASSPPSSTSAGNATASWSASASTCTTPWTSAFRAAAPARQRASALSISSPTRS